jgi:phospholipase D1/2
MGGETVNVRPEIEPTGRTDDGVEVLLTAGEAYPAFERAFLAAEREILLGFRVFDPTTQLRSDEARAIGETWSDLLVNTLQRGVAIRLVISDFDPIGTTELHRTTWRCMREFERIRERAGTEARLEVQAAMHPAEVGLLPRIGSIPVVLRKLSNAAKQLNAMDPAERDEALRDAPGLDAWMVTGADGKVKPKLRRLPHLHLVTHHQKIAVFDRKALYIGGLDLNDRRYDTKAHSRSGEETWHDVQVMMRGEVAEEAQAHLEGFLDIIAGTRQPPQRHKLVATLSVPRRIGVVRVGPRTVDRTIAEAYRRRIDQAQGLIYLETQFFRDLDLARRLAAAGRRRADLGLIIVLPAAPETVAFTSENRTADRFGERLQTRCIRIVSDAFGARFLAVSPAQQRAESGSGRHILHGAPLIYVHAKVSCFDLETAIVSSANLNGRSLAWDTEAGVVIDRSEDVARLRRRLFRHWLGADAEPRMYETESAVAAWRERVLANARAAPPDRRGFLLPYDIEAAERFGLDVPGVPEEMV